MPYIRLFKPDQSRDMNPFSSTAKSNKSHQLTLSSFLKISLGLCLTNFMIVARLHMFDESPAAAQQFLNKKTSLFQPQSQSIYIPNLTSFSDILYIFTNLDLQATFLLPLTLEISALFVALTSAFMNKIYLNLLVCLAGNLLAFLLLWFDNQNMFIYRATYIIQATLLYPLLFTSSFGLIKLFPKQILQIKGYFASLMFLLPQLSVPFSYWCMQHSEGTEKTQLFYSSILKFTTLGSVISFVTLYGVIENRESITHSLDLRLNSAIQTASLDPSATEIKELESDKEIMKGKLEMSIGGADFVNKNSPKVFETKPGSPRKKEAKFCISRQKLGLLITIMGLGIGVSMQLPELRKLLLTNLIQNNPNPQIEVALGKSTASSQLLVASMTIGVTLGMIGLIRRKKFEVFKLIAVNYMVGYAGLMLLFLVSNDMVRLSLWQIDKCIALGRIFFLAIIIPGIMLIEEAGMNMAEGVSILFVMGWAFELLLRILMLSLETQTRIFTLAVIAVGCCYGVEKIGKETKVEEDSWYNKFKQGVELQIETAAREEQESIEAKIEQQLKNQT